MGFNCTSIDTVILNKIYWFVFRIKINFVWWSALRWKSQRVEMNIKRCANDIINFDSYIIRGVTFMTSDSRFESELNKKESNALFIWKYLQHLFSTTFFHYNYRVVNPWTIVPILQRYLIIIWKKMVNFHLFMTGTKVFDHIWLTDTYRNFANLSDYYLAKSLRYSFAPSTTHYLRSSD